MHSNPMAEHDTPVPATISLKLPGITKGKCFCFIRILTYTLTRLRGSDGFIFKTMPEPLAPVDGRRQQLRCAFEQHLEGMFAMVGIVKICYN